MHRYVILGINHKYAPLEVRERLAYSDRRIPAALQGLRDAAGCDEAAILSTCNRVEVYGYTGDAQARQRILGVIAADHAFTPEYLDRYCYFHRGLDAVQHLMRVAGGLDSLVLGETQILSQVKRAYLIAQSENATAKALNGLFHRAFHVAKRLHSETEISRGQLSVSSVAIGFMDRVFEDLRDKTALLVGAGEVGELTLTYLRERGIGRVVVVSRTLDRARELAQRFQGDAVPLELLEDYLPTADIVVTQTSAETPILSRAAFRASQKKRGFSPVFVLDLAVPRDVEADASSVEGVFLYNVDDLEEVVAEHAVARSHELDRCNEIIRDEARKFLSGVQTYAAAPLIAALRKRAGDVREAELERLLARLSELPREQKDEIAQFAERLVNKLLHPQMKAIKEETNGADAAVLLRLARLLGIDNTVDNSEQPAPQPQAAPEGRG